MSVTARSGTGVVLTNGDMVKRRERTRISVRLRGLSAALTVAAVAFTYTSTAGAVKANEATGRSPSPPSGTTRTVRYDMGDAAWHLRTDHEDAAPARQLTEPQQHHVAATYLDAFFRRHLLGDTGQDRVLTGARHPDAAITEVDVTARLPEQQPDPPKGCVSREVGHGPDVAPGHRPVSECSVTTTALGR